MSMETIIQQLREDNEILKEELRAVKKEFLGDTIAIPPEWCLTASEAQILRVLVVRPMATKEQLRVSILNARNPDEGPEIKIIDVFICKIRKKLSPLDIEIKTVWGQGYSLDPKTRDELRAVAA